MTNGEGQQMLAALSEISKDLKALLLLVGELKTQQDKADSRAFQQLSQIAHKR